MKKTLTSDHRDLQGLSSYVLNLTLGYENVQRSVLLNLNKMAERIRKVGVIDGPDKELDQYEKPVTLIDLVWIEKFNYGYDFDVKVKAGNLPDEEVVWTQGGLVTRIYKAGRTLSMKISAKF